MTAGKVAFRIAPERGYCYYSWPERHTNRSRHATTLMDTPQQKRVRHVLVADDDRNDFLLVNLAFQKAGLSVNLSHVLDGQQAVNFLTANGHFKERAGKPLPDLLLLDLKMPMMDGFDVLTFLKNHPSLRDLAVVVLSASQIQEDISRALQLGAADFLTKPADFSELVAMMRSIFSRWLAEPGNHDAESKTVY